MQQLLRTSFSQLRHNGIAYRACDIENIVVSGLIHKADHYRSRKQKTKQDLVDVLKPVSSAVEGDGSFLFAVYTRKK